MSSSWIQTANRLRVASAPGGGGDPINLWPAATSTATWAAYSSALATLTINQINEGQSQMKYQAESRGSPLTPTTPTYAPTPSPPTPLTPQETSQPGSPHSETYADYLAYSLDYGIGGGKRDALSLSSEPAPKRSKSFTIDAILGLEEAASRHHQLAAAAAAAVTLAAHLRESSAAAAAAAAAASEASPYSSCASHQINGAFNRHSSCYNFTTSAGTLEIRLTLIQLT